MKLAAVAVVALCVSPTYAQQAGPTKPTVPQVVRRSLPAVVGLTVKDAAGRPIATGSGVVVARGVIVTNFHVIVGGASVTANFADGRSVATAGIVGSDTDRDLVLLAAPTGAVRPLPVSAAALGQDAVGTTVISIGSPKGLDGSVAVGVVSAIRRYKGAKVIQTSAPVSHGSSGGALLDETGNLIGVTTFGMADGQNLNFAYPAWYVSQMIRARFSAVYTWAELNSDIVAGAASKERPQSSPAPTALPDVPSAPDPPEPPKPPPVIAVDVRVKRRVNPSIPEALQGESLRGTITATFHISADGRFTVTMDGSGNAEVDRALKSQFERWQFEPARTADGTRVESTYSVTITIKNG